MSDRLFLWPWRSKAPFNMPPSLPDDDDQSYHNRHTFGYLRLDYAEKVFMHEVESWVNAMGVESIETGTGT